MCPRCGKILCNEQSLSYHLNKKTKCDKLICRICGTLHSTKANWTSCQNSCLVKNSQVDRSPHNHPIQKKQIFFTFEEFENFIKSNNKHKLNKCAYYSI